MVNAQTESLNSGYSLRDRLVINYDGRILSDDSYGKYLELQKINMEVFFNAALSPCVRRTYGAALFNFFTGPRYYAYNKRVTKCCDEYCIRNLMNIEHGVSTDLGAEVHAEQSLLVSDWDHDYKYHIFIAGWNAAGPLYGEESWPCYSCARIIKAADINRVWVPDSTEQFSGYSIDFILEEYDRRR